MDETAARGLKCLPSDTPPVPRASCKPVSGSPRGLGGWVPWNLTYAILPPPIPLLFYSFPTSPLAQPMDSLSPGSWS